VLHQGAYKLYVFLSSRADEAVSCFLSGNTEQEGVIMAQQDKKADNSRAHLAVQMAEEFMLCEHSDDMAQLANGTIEVATEAGHQLVPVEAMKIIKESTAIVHGKTHD
jgi:hypothetical protein